MDGKRPWLWVVVALAVVLALVGSAVAGALVGGALGFVAGRRTASSGWALGELPKERECPEVWPWEGQENLPWRMLPEVPEIPRRLQRGMTGALVQKVVEDSPADQAGLRVGDIIVAVNDEQVTAERALPGIIGQYRPGDEVRLTVRRGGEETRIDVRLGENPDNPERGYLGVYVVPLGLPELPVH